MSFKRNEAITKLNNQLAQMDDDIMNASCEPEILGEIATHDLLLLMDDDELFHHMLDTKLFNKIVDARKRVLSHVRIYEWGSIYEKSDISE